MAIRPDLVRGGVTVVLMYHDLRNDGDYTSWLRVAQGNFRRQIGFLGKIAEFLSPEDALAPSSRQGGRLRILLTFDDGQVNNYRLALPVLEENQAPALFFISTHNAKTGELFWFDRIIIPIQTKRLSGLSLEHLGLGNYLFNGGDERRRWDDIQNVLADVKAAFGKGGGNTEQFENVLRYFDELHEEGWNRRVNGSRPLTISQLKKMSTSGICHLGSHSHRHEILTGLSDRELGTSLEMSRALLEDVTGRDVMHISYPNGDFDERVIRFCRESGFRYGFTTIPKVVSRSTNSMLIPRIAVGGFDTVSKILLNILRAAICHLVVKEARNSPQIA